MDTFVHGLGRMLVCSLFSLVFMMAFFSYMYIQNDCVCANALLMRCSILIRTVREEKSEKKSKGENKATILFVEMLYIYILFDEK